MIAFFNSLAMALDPDGDCNCSVCYVGIKHWSDCSVHNEPAYPNGPCDCERGR